MHPQFPDVRMSVFRGVVSGIVVSSRRGWRIPVELAHPRRGCRIPVEGWHILVVLGISLASPAAVPGNFWACMCVCARLYL